MSDYLLISDAAKEVEVESHVLRYWEDELHLPIKRNELGHRFYTREDVERFRQIKSMKERGLQLKAIKMILKDGRLDIVSGIDRSWLEEEGSEDTEKISGKTPVQEEPKQTDEAEPENSRNVHMGIEILESRDLTGGDVPYEGACGIAEKQQKSHALANGKVDDKARRLQWILRQMMQEAVRQNNEELCREIKESVIKELDYQFRLQEERQEEREQENVRRSEEYYRRMDELLREKSRSRGFGRKGLLGGTKRRDNAKEKQKHSKGAVGNHVERDVEMLKKELGGDDRRQRRKNLQQAQNVVRIEKEGIEKAEHDRERSGAEKPEMEKNGAAAGTAERSGAEKSEMEKNCAAAGAAERSGAEKSEMEKNGAAAGTAEKSEMEKNGDATGTAERSGVEKNGAEAGGMDILGGNRTDEASGTAEKPGKERSCSPEKKERRGRRKIQKLHKKRHFIF